MTNIVYEWLGGRGDTSAYDGNCHASGPENATRKGLYDCKIV